MNELASTEIRYAALIGDLRGSRGAPDRSAVQVRLEAALHRLNQSMSSDLASDLVITVGDEFQGLLRRPSAVIDFLAHYDASMLSHPARFGIGWGRIDTPLKPTAIGMDGPCFHAARDALVQCKAEGRWVTVRGFGAQPDQILNGLFALVGGVRTEWTPIQAQTVAQMRNAASQKEVARTRGVAPPTVNRALQKALYGPLIEAEAALRILLDMFGI